MQGAVVPVFCQPAEIDREVAPVTPVVPSGAEDFGMLDTIFIQQGDQRFILLAHMWPGWRDSQRVGEGQG